MNVETPDGETVTTYLEWPGEGGEAQRASNASGEGGDPRASDHVDQLLDALGRDHSEFANVYGDRVALTAEDGWHGIDAEKTAAMRGAERASADDSLDTTRNLVAGAVGVGALGFTLSNALFDAVATLGGFFMVLAWLAIPGAMYFDISRVSEVAGWPSKTGRWLAGAAVPIANVPVGMAYLVDREVRLSGTTAGDVSELWYKSVLVSVGLMVIGYVTMGLFGAFGAAVFVYGWFFLPFALYFDAEYVEDATDWDPNEELWALGALLDVVFAPLVGGGYLVRRRQALN
ncbi:hypothetical protein M0R88_05830 [Halorussus gelatinilyticus]|uniref:Uncharacterized protein n=1 Tax=Halorussus gelatinilyticus TaxID=2937524 RepID=A0A8U0INN2_9EURY|nr:hypothetical protein [Halorussus gelatinilyticus]UPW01619.1 hypothetical protein M0R88_05830 [Halorussus gelatinilyticus]